MEASKAKSISIAIVLIIFTTIILGFLIYTAKSLHFLKTKVRPVVEKLTETRKELDEIRNEVESEIAELESIPPDADNPKETLERFERLIELYDCDEELLTAEEQMFAVVDILSEVVKTNSRSGLALTSQLLESVKQTISAAQKVFNKNKKSANIWRTFYFSPEISRRSLLSQLPKV